jgi:hypothetical protein
MPPLLVLPLFPLPPSQSPCVWARCLDGACWGWASCVLAALLRALRVRVIQRASTAPAPLFLSATQNPLDLQQRVWTRAGQRKSSSGMRPSSFRNFLLVVIAGRSVRSARASGLRRRQPGESGSCCGPCPALSPRAAPTLRAPLTATSGFQPGGKLLWGTASSFACPPPVR